MARRRRRKFLTFILVDKMAPRGGWRGISMHVCNSGRKQKAEKGPNPGLASSGLAGRKIGNPVDRRLWEKRLGHRGPLYERCVLASSYSEAVTPTPLPPTNELAYCSYVPANATLPLTNNELANI